MRKIVALLFLFLTSNAYALDSNDDGLDFCGRSLNTCGNENTKAGHRIYHNCYAPKTEGGNRYEGWWQNYKPNGQGTFTWSNGDQYMGEWKDGSYHGQGIFTLQNGEKTYLLKGDWVPNICENTGLTKGTSEFGLCVFELNAESAAAIESAATSRGERINLTPSDISNISNWVKIWREPVFMGDRYGWRKYSSVRSKKNIHIYLDVTVRDIPCDVGVYKVENTDTQETTVFVQQHFCENNIDSENYINSGSIKMIDKFKAVSSGQYVREDVDKSAVKLSYQQPEGQVHFTFCELLWHQTRVHREISLKRLNIGGNMKPLYESKYFKDHIKYDDNLMPFRNTKITNPIKCSPYFVFAQSGFDALVLNRDRFGRSGHGANIRYEDYIRVQVEHLNADFLSFLGYPDDVLTKECLDKNFNTFIRVVASNAEYFKNTAIPVESFYVGKGGSFGPKRWGELLLNRGITTEEHKNFNNHRDLNIPEIRDLYLSYKPNKEVKARKLCPRFFERKRTNGVNVLYHIKGGEKVLLPEHLTPQNLIERGWDRQDVRDECLERMMASVKGRSMNSENNPKNLNWSQIETIYENSLLRRNQN